MELSLGRSALPRLTRRGPASLRGPSPDFARTFFAHTVGPSPTQSSAASSLAPACGSDVEARWQSRYSPEAAPALSHLLNWSRI